MSKDLPADKRRGRFFGAPKVWPLKSVTVDGDIAHVTLTKGYTAIIDAADAPYVSQFNWRANLSGLGQVYARRSIVLPSGQITSSKMHRELLNAPAGMVVDHINGDTLDNRRINLRIATRAQNSRNRKSHRGSSSRFKGVSWYKQRKRWMAYIMFEGKTYHLGYFQSEEDAAAAYSQAAEKYHGPFRRVV